MLKTPYIFLFVFIPYLCIVNCVSNNTEFRQTTLAVVGDKIIDKDDFIERYKDFRRRTGAPDNGQVRRSLLSNYISEELLINEAQRRGYEKDAVGQHELERIRIQELLNAYHRRFIAEKITVVEDELKRLFVRLNTKIRTRHLYAPTRAKADSLYDALQREVPFEELARTTFQDPVLRESGGSLGYFTVDEMDPAFEEVAFSLNIGEISRPVRTRDGYSIIRVDDRRGNPLLTEHEYAKHRSKLEAYWKKRKMRKATKAHVDSLRHALDIRFHESTIYDLYAHLRKKNEERIFKDYELSQAEIPELENAVLAYSKLGTWSVKKFQEFARFTSEEQHKWIRNEEDLKDFIAGLVIRSYMLYVAKENRMHRTPDFKKRVAEQLDISLLQRIEDNLYWEFEIPDDSLRSYYEKDPARFSTPQRIHLFEIVLDEEDKAEYILAKLKKGVSFSDIAIQYSVN
ncbi:peptidylprolyl isomerase, partial [bacterium]|nr:peptidylprolyl isomerase [bacterium]